jgi:hypothetical protein
MVPVFLTLMLAKRTIEPERYAAVLLVWFMELVCLFREIFYCPPLVAIFSYNEHRHSCLEQTSFSCIVTQLLYPVTLIPNKKRKARDYLVLW